MPGIKKDSLDREKFWASPQPGNYGNGWQNAAAIWGQAGLARRFLRFPPSGGRGLG